MGCPEDWEGVAAHLLEKTGCDDPPVDSFELAQLCRFEVVFSPKIGAHLDESTRQIRVHAGYVHRKAQMLVSHELGHWAQRRGGLDDSEDGARFIGGAMLMPRRYMDRDIRATAWSLLKLQERHVNASALALAVRITQLRDAVATIIDPRGRQKPWRVPSPWISRRTVGAAPTRWEKNLAREAWETGGQVHGDELCYALPVIDEDGEGEDRVIVVCELEQLSLRL